MNAVCSVCSEQHPSADFMAIVRKLHSLHKIECKSGSDVPSATVGTIIGVKIVFIKRQLHCIACRRRVCLGTRRQCMSTYEQFLCLHQVSV